MRTPQIRIFLLLLCYGISLSVWSQNTLPVNEICLLSDSIHFPLVNQQGIENSLILPQAADSLLEELTTWDANHVENLAFALVNQQEDTLQGLLHVGNYDRIVGIQFQPNTQETFLGGSLVSVNKRLFPKDGNIIPISLYPGEVSQFYVKASNLLSSHSIKQYGILFSNDYIDEILVRNSSDKFPDYLINGIFLGIILFLMILLFAQFIQNRDKAYFFYALYLLFVGLYYLRNFEFQGHFPVFFSYFLEFYHHLEMPLAWGCYLAYFFFTKFFLQIGETSYPSINRFLNFALWLMLELLLAYLIFILVWGIEQATLLYDYSRFVLIGLGGVFIYQVFRLKNPLSLIVVTGTAILLGAGLYHLSLNIDWAASFDQLTMVKVPEKPGIFGTPLSIIKGGILIETFFFAVALGYKTRLLEKDRTLQAQLATEEQVKSKYQQKFFTNISHEFRTPLTLIMGPLRDWLNRSELPEKDRLGLQSMLHNAENLLGLVNRLLNLSRLDAGMMKLSTSKQDIIPFIRSIAANFDSWVELRSLEFQLDMTLAELHVWFDEEKLKIMLENLLSNAFKFTQEGGEVTLSVKIPPDNSNHYCIAVTDNGPGISPDDLPHVFDRFYQLDETPPYFQSGSGIGLALTKELVELHHGFIWVKSIPFEQTVFTIYLPLDDSLINESEKIEFSPSEMVSSHVFPLELRVPAKGYFNKLPVGEEAPVVLIVDDQTELRRYIGQQLEDQYHILEAADGREGLDLAKAQIPDLIVSDVMMPHLDGLSLIEKLRSDPLTNHIPIIILSAKARKADRFSGWEAGADAYLYKPFDQKELLLRVSHFIEQQKKLREKYQQIFPGIAPLSENGQDPFLQKVRFAIEQNLDSDQLTVDFLSKHMGVHRVQLHRKLKALTGESPRDFIRA